MSELKVRKIKDGTVIDHITAGHAFSVLHILGITGREGQTISVLLNVPSKKLGTKDIVKVENRELMPEEVNKIALIAPKATINIVCDYKVIKKKRVSLPRIIKGIVRCANPTCITNTSEPIEPTFAVECGDPLTLKCHYCSRILTKSDALKQLSRRSASPAP